MLAPLADPADIRARLLLGQDPVEVVSDSTYVVNCFRDRWWAGWQRNGWKNSAPWTYKLDPKLVWLPSGAEVEILKSTLDL